MTSFLSQVAMTNDAIKKRQQEDEDRAFKLREQQDKEAEMDQTAYLRPFAIKELQNQYEDAQRTRNQKLEQESLNSWVQPYQPKTGVNPDGTRSMDIAVPMGPAMAGAMAAGLGTMGNDLGGYMKPFQGQAIINSREYSTPEEVMKKAQLDEDHKRDMEIEGVRNAGRVQVAQTRKAGAGKTGTGKTPGTKAPRMTDFDRSFDNHLKQVHEVGVAEYYKENKRYPSVKEDVEIKLKAAKELLASPMYRNVSPNVRAAYLSWAAAETPEPAPVSPDKANNLKGDVSPEEFNDLVNQSTEINRRLQPASAAINLKENQGSVSGMPIPGINESDKLFQPPVPFSPTPQAGGEIPAASPYREGTVADVVWKMGQAVSRSGKKLPQASSFDAFVPGTFGNKPGYHQ